MTEATGYLLQEVFEKRTLLPASVQRLRPSGLNEEGDESWLAHSERGRRQVVCVQCVCKHPL